MTLGRRTAVDADVAYRWGLAVGEAAQGVPAAGGEAANWTVRGWAEAALGCLVVGQPEAYAGLDDAIRQSETPCIGPYAERLRTLRRLGGPLPDVYSRSHRVSEPADVVVRETLPRREAEACITLAEFCDSLAVALVAFGARRSEAADTTPLWANVADHLRWGERYRASPSPHGHRGYRNVDTDVPENLIQRSWMRLPSADGSYNTLLRPAARREATVRQRVRQGIHNGAHLDHLAALGWDGDPPRCPARLEYGTGLMAAEAYAMSIEILAAADCADSARTAEALELYRRLLSRMGRIPGFRAWQGTEEAAGGARAAVAASSSLRRAAYETEAEFASLPTLAGCHVTGPLRLIASGWADPLVPEHLAARARARWNTVCGRSEPAAALAARLAASGHRQVSGTSARGQGHRG